MEYTCSRIKKICFKYFLKPKKNPVTKVILHTYINILFSIGIDAIFSNLEIIGTVLQKNQSILKLSQFHKSDSNIAFC